jgi:arylsulfatase A-like enzyme
MGGGTEIRVPPPPPGANPEDLGGSSDLTRPALILKSGERVSCRVSVPAPSRLLFALALSEPSPRDLSFEIRLDGRALLQETLSAKRWNMWTTFSVPVSSGGAEVSFLGRIPGEKPVAIYLGSPRFVSEDKAPRILLWISQDALGADHLASYGYDRKTTPEFDRIAEKSVVFESAMAPATWTLPSLASQFTSRYPPFHGAVLQESARDPSTPTIFEILSKNGFTVLGVVGNRYVGSYFRMAEGFDGLWFSPGKAGQISALVDEALEEWGGGDLALFVHFMDNHFPYEPPAPFDTAFESAYAGDINGRNFFERRNTLTPKDLDHVRALYDSAALYADREIGGLLRRLEARGLKENVYLVYSADHGEGFQEHGRLLHAGTVYRELTHVPLALRFPGTSPRRVSQVVSLVDLSPTLLDALEIKEPSAFQGRSLMPLLRGEPMKESTAYSETQVTNNNVFWKLAVSEGAYRLIVKARRDDPLAGFTQEELYDLRRDPLEKHPLPPEGDGAGLKERARAYFQRAAKEAVRSRTAEIPADVRERLRALGYLGE